MLFEKHGLAWCSRRAASALQLHLRAKLWSRIHDKVQNIRADQFKIFFFSLFACICSFYENSVHKSGNIRINQWYCFQTSLQVHSVSRLPFRCNNWDKSISINETRNSQMEQYPLFGVHFIFKKIMYVFMFKTTCNIFKALLHQYIFKYRIYFRKTLQEFVKNTKKIIFFGVGL